MINIIAAYSENRVIGCNGKIPWDLPDDKQHFKQLTTGNVVVMGRKTYEEIHRPLPNRETVVISSNKTYDGCVNVRSFEEALRLYSGRNIFIAGGERLYRETLHLADKIYVTKILKNISGDRYFPIFDESLFTILTDEYVEGEIPHRYITYKRITEKR